MYSTEVTIHGKVVPVTYHDFVDKPTMLDFDHQNVRAVLESRLFQDWATKLDPRIEVRHIYLQSIDYFCPANPRLGFIKISVSFRYPDGTTRQKAIFLRGGAVAALVQVTCGTETYFVATEQVRDAIGQFAFWEIPAGTLEGADPTTKMLEELGEETGFSFGKQEVIDLTTHCYPNLEQGIYLSPGACDEYIRIFLVKNEVSRQRLDAILGQTHGVAEEGESIQVKLLSLEEMYTIPDAKTRLALSLYEQYQKSVP